MARPRKQGLEYFPFECDFFADERMVAIAGEFGLKGEIITVHLLCAIYRNGYFVEWGDLMKFKLMKELPGVSVDLLDNVVSRLVRWGIFDEGLFNSVGVLTSEAIQQTFFSVARKRVTTGEFPYVLGFRGRNTRLSVVSDAETQVSDAETPQSKGKEIKNSPNGEKKEPSPPSKLRFLSFEQNVHECLQDQVWRESVQMNLLVKITDWKQVFTEFRANLIANGSATDKTRQDFRKHFTNWFRIKKQNENGRNDQKNMGGNDRTGGRASLGRPSIAPAKVVAEDRGKSCI
ncbi:MAG: DUF4373 domain-containing protein [Clostridiales bacterium]|nr:DUF4373 domain-containing protein [Clostridiales bacterium]